MKKVIFILADAFKSEYINVCNLEFLKEEITKTNNLYIEKIYPSTGFCEIIEYVTGKPAEENGYLAQIAFKEEWEKKEVNINYWLLILEKIEKIMSKIPKIRWIYFNFVNKILKKYISEEMIRVRYKIPITLLEYFKPTESVYSYDSIGFGGESNIFYKLKEKGVSYDIDDFVKYNKIKGTDNGRLENLITKIKNKDLKGFTLLYIGYGEIAHYNSVKNNFFNQELKNFDIKLREVVNLLKKNYEEYELMILGDHGMVNIENYFNIYPIIEEFRNKFNLNLKKDYMYFIDSTMFRLSLKNKLIISEVRKFFKDKLKGYYEENLEDYFNKFDSKYGDIKILLKPGNVFYPDYFNYKKNKGMHGYNSKTQGQEGTFVSISSQKLNQEKFKEKYLYQINEYIIKELIK